MKKTWLVIILLLCISKCIVAQGWYRNYEKYWWYRYRLVNDFMKIGPGYGESIPAYKRTLGYTNGQVEPGNLHFGDATQALGHYISVTATEFRILDNNNWSTIRTAMENFYAQNAFERVDKYAETYCYDIHGTYPNNGIPGSNDLNGFFIRDDVPGNFVYSGNTNNYNYKHFNRPGIINTIPIGNNLNNTYITGGVRSDYYERASMSSVAWAQNYNPPGSIPSTPVPPQYPKEESQDQLSEVMVGLGLTTMYLNGAIYNGQNLEEKAADNAYRAVDWAASGPGLWIIKNPVAVPPHCVYGNESNYYFHSLGCEKSGAIAWVAAPAIAKTANIVAGSYHNTSALQFSAQAYDWIFQLSQLANMKEQSMLIDNYVAFARNWRNPFLPVFNNTSWKWIKKHSENENFQTPHIPLIYRLKHAGEGSGLGDFNPPTSYELLMDISNFCGNFKYHSNPYPYVTPQEWETQDRLSFAFQRGDPNNDDFNGLDYMELFNLYTLLKGDYIQWVINPYYQENYAVNYPDNNGYGSNSNWLTLNYLEYLSLVNSIANNGHVTFRGAKVVDMLPGFNTDMGAVLTAYVEDYDCRSNEYHYASNAPNGLNDAPIEYNPTGQTYHKVTEPGINENINYEDSLAEATSTPELEAQFKEAALAEIKRSPFYHEVMAMYPELFKENSSSTGTNDDVIVFPNPNRGSFSVTFSRPGKYQLRVLTMEGQNIHQTDSEGRKTIEIDLEHLPSGTYVVNIIGEGNNFMKKIVVIK